MSSVLNKVTLPAALIMAMLAFMGILSSGSIRTASAVEGDVCQVFTNASPRDDFDGFGNTIYPIEQGKTYGLVFRIEDDDGMSLVSRTELDDEEVIAVAWEEGDLTGTNVEVRIDSETGSGRITSKAEILTLEEQDREIPGTDEVDTLEVPNVGHTLIQPGVGTQVLDTISPRFFNDADGNELDNIGEWLLDVGYPDFVGNADGVNVCGDDETTESVAECGEGTDCEFTSYLDDSWGFLDFECIQPGYFHIDILTPDDTEETGRTLKFYCGGQAETAEITASPATVETQPAGNSVSASTVVVTVKDQFGDRIDGAKVLLTTDNCTFKNPLADSPDDLGLSPAGGGTTVTIYSDTDSVSDAHFLTNNPLEHSAGTAEASLDCANGKPGVARVTAIIERPGADIVLNTEVKVVGPASVSGLTLVLTPESLQCGGTIKAEATAVDVNGVPVSDGTLIRFTTDTSSGVVGGTEGAQGAMATVGGKAIAHVATDPSKPGSHTVIAYVLNNAGTPNAMVSETYVCDSGVGPAAPPAGPGGVISPPNTGDAGLASATGSAGLPVVALAAALVTAGLATVRLARNEA